jgi:hypothetical protein
MLNNLGVERLPPTITRVHKVERYVYYQKKLQRNSGVGTTQESAILTSCMGFGFFIGNGEPIPIRRVKIIHKISIPIFLKQVFL